MVKPCLLAGALPGLQAVLQGGLGQAVGFGVGLHQVGEQGLAVRHPFLGRGAGAGHRPPVLQRVQQLRQRAGQFGVQATYFGIGRNGLQAGQGHVYRLGAAGIAQQHAAQAKPGAVLVATGVQPQVCAVRGVQAPADARARHPLRELGQRLGRNAKARGHGGHFQQIDQLAHTAALRGQAQEPGHGGNQRAAGLGAHVGNVKRDIARVTAFVLAKHRADGRGQRLDVGHHDDDVARV